MYYLNQTHLESLGVDWEKVIDQVFIATKELQAKNFEQPMKTYLRYGDPKNRIIAMPAFLGGAIHTSGIKWIASFPQNLEKGLNRASSVTILNDADTGYPFCIINTATISVIRTASVTGMVLKKLILEQNKGGAIKKAGIIGFGPIGQMHLAMLDYLFEKQLEMVVICDVRPIDSNRLKHFAGTLENRVVVSRHWQDAYKNMDIVITCTNTVNRYIDLPPKNGSYQMNISLRDYKPQINEFIDFMIVDNWKEVCREDTDIEAMHKHSNLQKSNVHELPKLLFGDYPFPDSNHTVMFNPMGMSIYDIAMAKYYYELAKDRRIGMLLG